MKSKKMDPRNNPYNTLLISAAGVAYRATDAEIAALPVPPGHVPSAFRAEFRQTIDKIVRYREAGQNSPAAAHATAARFDYVSAWDDHDLPAVITDAEDAADRQAEAVADAIRSHHSGGQPPRSTENDDENDPHNIARSITAYNR